jgi:molybdate transport system substrate-binding protein
VVPKVIRVAAASDLQTVLPRLAERFREQTGVEVVCAFGASGRLAEQIKAGAPFDLFMSANERFVRELADQGLIVKESMRPYARGTLVLAVFRNFAGGVRGIGDLTEPTFKKIAIANPTTAPYGLAARQALEKSGLWRSLEPRIVIADSVAQALLYAQKGDAEAALVGRSIARVPEVAVVEIDKSLYDPIVQTFGMVTETKMRPEAERFASFILGNDGQSILREAGFAGPAG